jgi:integrase
MPANYEMSWEGAPHFRWVRMHKGTRYRVKCRDLGLPPHLWTKQDSYQAANEWWVKKQAELDMAPLPGNDPRKAARETLDYYLKYAEPEEVPAFRAARAALDTHPIEGPAADDNPVPPPDLHIIHENRQMLELFGASIPATVPDHVLSATLGHARVNAERVRMAGEVDPDATVGKLLDRWVTVMTDEWEAATLREVCDFVKEFKNFTSTDPNDHTTSVVFSGDWLVSRVNEDTVENMFIAIRRLSLGLVAQKKRWQRWRQWVEWLSEKNKIERPRNLRSKSLVISVPKKKPKVVTLETAQAVLAKLPSRFKLYALLGINASMNPIDVGKLRKEMIDFKKGTLTKRRVKTEDEENVPEVTYKLWPETLDLLRAHLSPHPELALTSSVGTPLHDCRKEGGKAKMNTLLTQQWGDQKTGMTFTDWRDLGANLIYGNKKFRDLRILYLGHAPHGVSDIHYINPPEDILDEALGFVREQLFPTPKKAKKSVKSRAKV